MFKFQPINETMKHPGWRKDEDEIGALGKNGTWIVTYQRSGKRTVGCKWIFTVKHGVLID